jgi:uncharacterized repeat protein (TIGR03803 family)
MRPKCSGFSSPLSANNPHRTPILAALYLGIAMLLVQAAAAQTFTVLYRFSSGVGGAIPSAGLTIDSRGNLYGTTLLGGVGSFYCFDYGCGTVFKLEHRDAGWVHIPIYKFHERPISYQDGASPAARVIFGPDGALYGTTIIGGFGGLNGNGTIFRLAAACHDDACPWIETRYDFPSDYSGGYAPQSGDLVFDSSGNLYGTTYLGGVGFCDNAPFSCGVAYEIPAPVQQWHELVLYDFTQDSGFEPLAGATVDGSGDFFGTANAGGTADRGVVYRMTQSGGSWIQSVLYSFLGQDDGARPNAGLIRDSSGNLYGATVVAGAGGGGTVYELSPSGGSWTFSLIYSFSGSAGPAAALTMDAAGNLYGTTYGDGAYGFGNVFKLTKSNDSWTYTSLYDFTGGDDGANPMSNVVFDSAGNLYGTTPYGGETERCFNGSGCGVVWEITP